MTQRPSQLPPGLKVPLELGPLVLFFLTYWKFGIFPATGVLMVGVLIALAVSYALLRRIPIMPLVTAVMVLIFGGLTLILHDATFLKMKVTIVYGLFGAALLGGLAFGKPLLPVVLDSVLDLDEPGWRTLTLRWGLFFFALAILNEIVWRNFDESVWVAFKAFGTIPLTLIFAISQVPLILQHERTEGAAAEAEAPLGAATGVAADAKASADHF